MAIQDVNASLRGPKASVVKYDIVAAINGAGLTKSSLSKDVAQRLTLIIVSRYNWLTNEISAGHMQLSALWSVDLRRVKRILTELRTLGILAVKRAGRKGLVTVYRLDLAKIAEITRPFWHVLAADIAARLDTAFPDENTVPAADEDSTSRVEQTADADASPTNVVKIDEARRQRADPVRQAIAREVAPPAFDRWIRPLIHERREDCLVFVAPSSFVANYVERQFGHKIERAIRQLFPEIRRVTFTVALNRPGFTGGQNSRRIARYGTDTEEDLEAVFTRVSRTRGAAGDRTPRCVSKRSCGADGDRKQIGVFARQPSRVGAAGPDKRREGADQGT